MFAGHWVWKSPSAGQDDFLSRSAIVSKYAVAVLLALLALGLDFVCGQFIDGGSLFILYVMASMTAAWYGGLGPGIASLIIGLLLADFFFVEPVFQFGPNSLDAIALMLIHAFTAGIGFIAIVNLHRARVREQQIEILAGRLQHEVAEHRKALDELREAKAQLDEHAGQLEKKVAERTANLVETVHSLESVLYHVAHDLRAPLRALSGLTQVLMDSLGPRLGGEDKECMDRITAAAQRMDRLILDLLAYGRLGHTHVTLRRTGLEELTRNVVNGLEPKIKARQATVEIIPPMPNVQADPRLLSRAIEELLCNALTFTALGVTPRVRIWAEVHESRVRLWVEDNGIGIEPLYHERIFRVFERLYQDEDDTRTGIGLAMVTKTMERLGGQVGVESEPCQGSRFWLELPAA